MKMISKVSAMKTCVIFFFKLKVSRWQSDLDEHTRLVVCVSGEGLGLLGGDGSVPLNKHGHDSPRCLDAQR